MKKSLSQLISTLTFLPNRTPEMAFTGEGDNAFAEVTPFRDGAIYIGHYSGNSEWERHPAGDELVMVLSGTTTVVLLKNKTQEKVLLQEKELVVVPQGIWHRFEGSLQLQVLTITPKITDHSIELPDA
jgi:mannose-6-phosphate isomerase-like protein (cupin superfamily)